MDKLIATKGETKIWLRGGTPNVGRVGIESPMDQAPGRVSVRAYNSEHINLDTLLTDLQAGGFTIYPPVQANLLINAPVVRDGNS